MLGINDISKNLIESKAFQTAVEDQDYEAMKLLITDLATAVYLATANKCARTYGRFRLLKLPAREMKQKIRETEPPTGSDYLGPL